MPLSHKPDVDESEADQPLGCPACSKPMEKVQEADITIDRCTACGGLWLDALEKDRILANKGAAKKLDPARPTRATDVAGSGATSVPPAQKKTLCPRDTSTLIRMVDHKQRHIHYESCKVCGGAFFHAGDLRDLGSFSLLDRLRSLLRG
jgi:uncharacterized protein